MLNAEHETRALVCEGPSCNPHLSVYDSLVRQYRQHERMANTVEPIYDRKIVDMGRRQKHTLHRKTRAVRFFGSTLGEWECTTCGHVKRF